MLKTVQIGYHWTLNPFDQYGDGAETVANVVQTSVTTKWPVGSNYLVSQVQTDYDSSFTFNPNTTSGGTYGVMTEKREYGYATNAPGALLRKTDYTYAALTNSNYLSANLLNLVAQETVYDGSANKVAQTTNSYDGTTLQSSGVTTQHFNLANPGYRGNLTLVQKWLNTTGGTVTTSQRQYYDTGMPYISTDLKNNQTQYTYDPAYVGAYVTKTQYPNTGSGITHYIQGAYDFNTGLLTSFTDQNLQVSNYGYDLLGRITTGAYPDGGSVGFQYTDTVPMQIQKTVAITSTLNKVTNSVFDGAGRLSELQLHDPDCTVGSALVKTDYAYGNDTTQNTHYTTVTTPYCDTPGTTFGLPIRTDSDALGRTLKITQADGSVATTSYAASSTTLSECTTATDEAGKARTSCTDALGRMTGVWEDPGTSPHLNYETDYGYNLLDDLTSVNQKGDNSAPRARSFVYDSLSRLSSATNPESGTISYTYSNGSSGCAGTSNVVCTKTALSPNQPSTGTATVTTTYTYDALNRLTNKSYADSYAGNPATPAVQYGYDGTALAGCTTSPPSLTDSYPVGLRTAMCDASGATSWAHDKMGRVLQAESVRARATKNVFDTYNLDGSVASLTTVGYALNYKYNAAGRPISVKNTVDPFNYVTSASYAPFGGLATASLGAAPITVSNQYNSRLQPSLLSASAAATIMSLSYDFHSSTQTNNGNVFQIANNRDANRTQNFLYDSLNRIQQAYTTGPNWGETFSPTATAPGVPPTTAGIDPWGNLLNRSGVTGKTYTEPLSCSVNTNNQLTACSFNYDAAGNMISNGTTGYTYDDENRLIATAGMSYIYDGDGMRVEKCTEGATPGTCATGATGTLYWGPGAETDLAGNTLEDYIFFNGQRMARREPGTPATFHFYFSDHLGTHSLITDQNGTMPPQSESDYFPYGDEIPISGSDSNHYKFTGKERDSESGLDYFGARHYASSLARFMVPDWAAKPTAVPYAHFGNPQSLNLYSYVENKPTTVGDPDGHETETYDDGTLNRTTAQNAPMSETEIQIHTGILEIGSAFATGGATLEAQAGGAVLKTILGTITTTGLAVSGSTRIIATAAGEKPENIEKGAQGVAVATSPAGIATAIATNGNMKKASMAADAQSAVQAMAAPKEAAKDPAGTALTVSNVVQDVKSLISPPAPPPPPPPPPAPRCVAPSSCH